jgi:Tol biopolymer transport system component
VVARHHDRLHAGQEREEAAIFTIRTDGTGLTQLTPYKLDAASPDWSPDGSTLAFNTYWDAPHGNHADLATIPASGGKITYLTHGKDGEDVFISSFRPSWAPDGTKLVYSHFVARGEHGDVELWTINSDGRGTRRLTHFDDVDPLFPDWGTAL